MTPAVESSAKRGADGNSSPPNAVPYQRPQPSTPSKPDNRTLGNKTEAVKSPDPVSWEDVGELSKHCDFKIKWLAFYLAETARETEQMMEKQSSLMTEAFRLGNKKPKGPSSLAAFTRFLPVAIRNQSINTGQGFVHERLLYIVRALCLPDVLEPDLMLLPEPFAGDLASSIHSESSSS